MDERWLCGVVCGMDSDVPFCVLHVELSRSPGSKRGQLTLRKPSEFCSDFIEELLGTPGQRQDVSVEMEVENQHTSVKCSQQGYLGRTHWFRVSEGLELTSPKDWTHGPQGAFACNQRLNRRASLFPGQL